MSDRYPIDACVIVTWQYLVIGISIQCLKSINVYCKLSIAVKRLKYVLTGVVMRFALRLR